MTTRQDGVPVHEAHKYYITTAIDYPNAPPHIGHALEKVLADVVARYHRLWGEDTYFCTGVDENSQHVGQAAVAHGVDVRTWVSQMDEAFRLAWSKLDIAYDYWMRTTEARHTRASQEMFRRAQERGDIYLSTYEGWYCPNCNAFYTAEELVDGHCPIHQTLTPEWVEEENYFFALSKYSDRLLAHIEANPKFIVPAQRRAEVLGMLRQGLRDFSVSRLVKPGVEAWGIPVPGDERQVIYVWFDALINYLTGVGFPDTDAENAARFERYWPADVHLIGKDITRFHCLYWPAMLMSAGLPLPKQVAVHGFITLEGQRISKTTGNIIDPVALVDEVGADAVRYYLMRTLSMASDGDFSRAGLLQHYANELGNDLGNLLNRVVSMTQRYRNGLVPQPGTPGPLEKELQQVAAEVHAQVPEIVRAWDVGGALGSTWSLVKRANQYLEQSEPWKLAHQPAEAERLDTVLYSAAEATRLLAVFLAPYIPSSSARMLAQLSLPPVGTGAWNIEGRWGSVPLRQVVPGPLLFPRLP
jgi:methionyl-tRNA synthetase